MRLNSYTIYDSATCAYSRPFFAVADGEAVRQFGDIACDESHPIGKHPEHYRLYRNGIFNDKDGEYTAETPTHLANGHELAAANENIASPGGTE